MFLLKTAIFHVNFIIKVMSKLFHASILHWWITGCLWRINSTLGWILWHIPDFLAPRFLETASPPVGFFLIYIKLGLDWKRLALSASEPLQVGSAQIFFGIVLERKNFAFSLSSTRKFTFSTTLKFSREEEWTRKSLWYPLYFGKRPM